MQKVICNKIMRDSWSCDKKNVRGLDRLNLKSSLQSSNYFSKQTARNAESQAKMLQEFYFNQMLKFFEENNRKIPDPIKIVEGIRAKQLKIKEMEHQYQQLRLKVNTYSQINSKYLLSSKKQIPVSPRRQEKQQRDQISNWDQNTHLLLTQFLKSFTPAKQQQITKFSNVNKDKVLQEFLKLIKDVFKSLENQISISKHSSETKLSRVKSEENFDKILGGQNEMSTRYRKKLDQLIAELNQSIETRKYLQEENKELHMNVLRTNTAIVSKNERIQQLSRKLDQLTKEKIISGDCEEEIGLLKQQNQALKTKNTKIQKENTDLLSQLRDLKNEFDRIQKKSISPRKKIRQSMSAYTSTNNQEEDNPKNSLQIEQQLYEQIRILEFKNKIQQQDHKKYKKELQEKERLKLQGMVEQWRDYLKTNIEEMNVQLAKKDGIIEELKQQIKKRDELKK